MLILAACIVFVVFFSNCAGAKKCPAYSQISTQQVHGNS